MNRKLIQSLTKAERDAILAAWDRATAEFRYARNPGNIRIFDKRYYDLGNIASPALCTSLGFVRPSATGYGV